MEKILNAVDEFTRVLLEKGYDGEFYINGGFPGDIKSSLLSYVEFSILGLNKGFSGSMDLQTYVFNNVDPDYSVLINMDTKYNAGKLEVQSMRIDLLYRFQQPVDRIILNGLQNSSVPNQKDAQGKVQDACKQIRSRTKGRRI